MELGNDFFFKAKLSLKIEVWREGKKKGRKRKKENNSWWSVIALHCGKMPAPWRFFLIHNVGTGVTAVCQGCRGQGQPQTFRGQQNTAGSLNDLGGGGGKGMGWLPHLFLPTDLDPKRCKYLSIISLLQVVAAQWIVNSGCGTCFAAEIIYLSRD